uniref:nucleotidyltransferase family protein n=1 Tax=Anaerovibrio lipolyticus TaxID=82374 RepID=UPI0023F4C4F0
MITGIIADYNPFHNGHLYQINKIREKLGDDTNIIACISGGISQRGELPILDKWQRAFLAVENGANLVLEIPAVFSCRSAQ